MNEPRRLNPLVKVRNADPVRATRTPNVTCILPIVARHDRIRSNKGGIHRRRTTDSSRVTYRPGTCRNPQHIPIKGIVFLFSLVMEIAAGIALNLFIERQKVTGVIAMKIAWTTVCPELVEGSFMVRLAHHERQQV
ncbi:MAG: hypothetical protein SVO26_06530 [Chloroflexota bacterium]|nr:hypothetical protein [Chloroflexota bacterium]